MNSKKILGKILTLFILIVLITVISCNKNEEIGYNVHPQDNTIGVYYKNDIPVLAHTIREDSIRTDETYTNIIGSVYDPVFGTTTAGMFVQFRLSDNNVTFGTNPVCDSLVLSLAYRGLYGDTNYVHTINVYEILESFSIDNAYYSNQYLGTYKNNLCNSHFVPNLKDSVILGTSHFAPHMRVKLKNILGQKIIAASGTSNLADNTNFSSFFKGLFITVKKADFDGSMIYINPTATLSKLILYYHNDNGNSTYSFPINDNSARYNVFDHYNYSNANTTFKQQLKGDTTLGEQTLYLQTMGGTKVLLKFPEAVKLNDLGNIAINKAELVLKLDETNIDTYLPPEALSMSYIKNDETLSFLPDYTLYGDSYFGGKYNSVTKEYRFNIGKYLQNALVNNSFDDKGVYLTISGAAIGARRLVFFGPQNNSGKLRLEVIYSIIK